MRYDAPFLVRRYAPMIGRPESPRRLTVAFQAYRLEEALTWARQDIEARRRLQEAAWPHPVRPAVLFIERRGQGATRPKASPGRRKRPVPPAFSGA